MADSRALTLKVLGDVSSLNKSLKDAQNSVNGAGMSIERSFDQVKKAVTVASAAVVGFAVAYGKTAVEAASNLAETIAKTGEIFGDSRVELERWAEGAADAFGQSQRQALDAASTFAIFGKSAGLAGDDLVNFSTDFVALASDLASFNNTSPEQAITAIGAALRGEAEPIRQYGVLINEAALRQAALELGIVKTTKEALTPQQRVLAAQKLIFEQTDLAQGDFARTSEGLANQQRILKARLEDVSAELGEQLLPYVTDLTQYINEKAIPFIKEYKDEIKLAAGIVLGLATAVLAVNAALKLYNAAIVVATAATAIFNAIIAGNPIGLIIVGIGLLIVGMIRLEQQTGYLRRAWEILTNALKEALDWFKRIANFFGADFETAAQKHQATMKRNIEVYDESRRMSNQVTDGLRMGVLPAMKEVDEQADDTGDGLDDLGGDLDDLTNKSQNTTKALREQLSAMQALEAIRMGFEGALSSTGPGVFASDGESRRSQAELVSQFGGLIPGFNQLPTDPFFGFGKGSDIRTFKPGQGAVQAGNVIINVTGTVVDPEGAARAIQSVIQNSNARAGNLPFVPALGIE